MGVKYAENNLQLVNKVMVLISPCRGVAAVRLVQPFQMCDESISPFE